MNVKSGLRSFVKNECANFDDHFGGCFFNNDNKCSVLEGKRCGYFEQSVLGKPDYKYKLLNYDYGKLFEQYAAINPRYLSKMAKVSARICVCGEPLLPRQRFCDNCKRRRRQKSYRLARKKPSSQISNAQQLSENLPHKPLQNKDLKMPKTATDTLLLISTFGKLTVAQVNCSYFERILE